MKKRMLLCAALTCVMTLAHPAPAQEKGDWRPVSKTAESITGEVEFSKEKISINVEEFTIAQIRSLKPEEAVALFDVENAVAGKGNLYRFDVPAAKKFLHRNTLCGDRDTEWIATWVSGHSLQMALFAGVMMPVLARDALANSQDVCGTYSYIR